MSIYDKYIGKHVVVRSCDAGVHIGTLAGVEGDVTVLNDARRLWKWAGAFTLSEVALAGVTPNGSRMSVAVPDYLVKGFIEVLPTTAAARATFDKTGS